MHCHDGSGGELASFSLRPEDFLAYTIDQPTESSASGAGIRIVPGDPEASALYIAFAGIEDGSGLREMPPLSVQRRDEASLRLLREWIERLDDDD